MKTSRDAQKPKKILIVEDEPDVFKVLSKRFLSAGYQVHGVQDAVMVMTEVLAFKPDLIMLDLMLPGGGGLSVLEKIGIISSTQNIPVVVLTGIRNAEYKKKVLAAGVDAYVEKPYEFEELLLKIQEILGGQKGTAHMTKKILVVDDEKDVVSVLLKRLKAHGYEAASAGDGQEALNIIKKEKFDLVILDIMMPGMDGAELGGILKNDPKTKNIPLIFLTALGVKIKKVGYEIAGPDIVFAKPFDIQELLNKIDEILKRA